MLSRAYIDSADWRVKFLTLGKTDEEMSEIMQKLQVFITRFLTNVFGEDFSSPPAGKNIKTELNVKRRLLKLESFPQKEKITSSKKALRRAPYKLFGIFKVHELITIQAAF